MRKAAWIVAVFGLSIGLGCEIGPGSGRGLRLPDGDLARGAQAFADLGCGKCHSVVGEVRKERDRDSQEPNVLLGGEVSRVHSYGELVTSIVNPSHDISRRYPREEVAEGEVSKMELENFNERMTVAQLIDLVAYLQSKYERRREPIYIP